MYSRPIFDDTADSLPQVATEAADTTRLEFSLVKKRLGDMKVVQMLPSEITERFVHVKDSDNGGSVKMDFSERRYLRRVYDTPHRNVMLMTSRQTEKCVVVTQPILMADGSIKPAGEVVVGDVVASLQADGQFAARKVVWVSRRRTKPSLRIETRQGHSVELATTHPVRVWDAWCDAGKLRVGDRVAAARRAGDFGELVIEPERVRLTAYLIGDGGLTQKSISFTSLRHGPTLDEFLQDVASLGGSWREYEKVGGRAVDIRLRQLETLERWLEADGLRWKSSGDKALPAWVFGLTREQTAMFINRLWATDGHVSQRAKSIHTVAYCSTSQVLVQQLQALLWKFGIPSRIRRNWPSYHKTRGVEKYAWILHVETQPGVRAFLSEIGALGKSEHVALPTAEENSNQDTLPIHGVQDLIDRAVGERWRTKLFAHGLGKTLPHAPTRGKVLRYVDVLRSDEAVDQSLVDELEQHATDDIYWDRVTSITPIGEQECVDFEVEDTHNFVVNGVVTHNSTTIANKMLTQVVYQPGRSSLFVTPSAMQTTVFSRARIDEIVDVSPLLKSMTHPSLVMNLLEKRFITDHKIYLRYAFLSADRSRGLSVNNLFVDEIQDVLSSVMPVLEETISHHKNTMRVYSGTPKSFDNSIEEYWSKSSTQSEWAIPCERHGAGPPSWHWNILDTRNLGKKGPICSKCGNLLNPEHPHAQWVAMNPGENVEFEGYRLSRLMVPWFFKDPAKWKEILHAYERYPTAQFMNEVMALSYDSGTKPLSRYEMIRACDSKYTMDEDAVAKLADSAQLYAGTDWGTGEHCYTIFTVGGYVRGDDSFQIVYSKRFDGPFVEPELQMAEIYRLIEKFRIKYVGADYGMGFHPNKLLTAKYGPKRIHQFQYASRAPAKVIFKPQLFRYLLFRTPLMSDVFSAIKNMKIRFPSWDVYKEPYAKDILSIRSEYSDTMKMIRYDKPKTIPDDTFHSVLYTLLASMLDRPRPDIIAPLKDRTQHDARRDYLEALAIENAGAENFY